MYFKLLYVCDECHAEYMHTLNFVQREDGHQIKKCAFCNRKKYSYLYIVTPKKANEHESDN